MRIALALACLIVSIASPAGAADEKNPFDVSSMTKMIKEFGLPSASSVAKLRATALERLDDEDCAGAIPALDEYAKHANWLSNLVSSGLAPFYRSSFEVRKSLPQDQIDALVHFEQLANDYKTQRNRALVKKAECLVELGRPEEAVPILMSTLELFRVDDPEWWNRARSSLYALIEIE